MESKDFCIVQIDKKKTLVKFLKKKKDIYTGVVASTPEKDKIIFKDEHIIAKLGNEPSYGSAYGVKVEPFINTTFVDPIGTVNYYRHLEKKEKELLLDCLETIGNKFSDLDYIEAFPLTIDIRHKKGMYAGTYKVNGDDGDIMTLQPALFEDKKIFSSLVFHELGHMIWFHHLEDKQKAKWINLYHKGVQLQNASKEDVKEVCTKFYKSKLDIGSFYDQIDEDSREELIFDQIVEFMEDKHDLKAEYVDTLINAGESIKHLLPSGKMKMYEDYNILLTEYSKKSPEELFSEAVSYYLSEFKIENKETLSLIKETLKV